MRQKFNQLIENNKLSASFRDEICENIFSQVKIILILEILKKTIMKNFQIHNLLKLLP